MRTFVNSKRARPLTPPMPFAAPAALLLLLLLLLFRGVVGGVCVVVCMGAISTAAD